MLINKLSINKELILVHNAAQLKEKMIDFALNEESFADNRENVIKRINELGTEEILALYLVIHQDKDQEDTISRMSYQQNI